MSIQYENFEREKLEPIYDIIAPYSEMAKNERYFLNGMIRYFKPKKILEVGVSSGGGSALILNAISDIEGAELYSVDYSEKAYRHPEKVSGFLVEEKFSNLMGKWHVFRDGDVSRFIEEIGGDIDMLVLDTVHVHPWETLNFLCVLPFMKQSGSWTVLHDISYFAISKNYYARNNGLACRYLFGHVVSDDKILPVSDYEILPPNIGAFRVSEVTMKYAVNLFESLFITWSSRVEEIDFEGMKEIISKYYPNELYESFCNARTVQNHLMKNPAKGECSAEFKKFIRTYFPVLYSVLRKIRHPF